MKSHRAFPFLLLIGIVELVAARAEAAESIPNWAAPAFWQASAAQRSAGVSGVLDGALQVGLLSASSPFPFIAITPCRVADTRGNAAPIQGGIFANSEARNWTVWGVCGIPSEAAAVSVNFTVTGSPPTIPQGAFLLAWPAGQPPPPTAIMTYGPAQTISNAAVVPLNASGQMTVNVSHSTHIIMDVNGYYAGSSTTGTSNTFLGRQAGNSTMTGDDNTGIGRQALYLNAAGHGNTAIGFGTLVGNTGGHQNTALGYGALFSIMSGNGNIGLGVTAGDYLNTGSNNIYIGHHGVVTESETIRLGSTQTATYIAGVFGADVSGGSPVFATSEGRLGTLKITSSHRFKEDIRDIAEESDGLMKLRPVAFTYKRESDPSGLPQYGLIAEEVAEVYPDLVACGRDGQPETVRYHLVNALLLNEVQKQHRMIENQRTEIDQLKERLRKIEARMPL